MIKSGGMTRRVFSFISIVVFFIFVPFGCEKEDPDGTTGPDEPEIQNGILSVWVTDAPFPIDLIDEARVTVVGLELREQDDTVFRHFSDDTLTFDLLSLRNGMMESLASKKVASGIYDQMRLVIDRSSLVLKDGRTSVLKVPGGPQSGLKINFTPSIRIYPGMVANVLLDFDLSRSFILTGDPKSAGEIKRFNFKPVIRAAVIDSTGMVGGIISDVSGQPLENAEVWISGDSVIARTFSNSGGAYAMLGIPEGTFRVAASLEGYVAREISGIQISTMEKTVLDVQLSGAK